MGGGTPGGGREGGTRLFLTGCVHTCSAEETCGGRSARVLLLVAQVELAQLPLPHAPRLVGFGGAAGAGGLR